MWNLLISALSLTAYANPQALAGRWILDEKASDPLLLPEIPAGGPPPGARPPPGGMGGGPPGGMGGGPPGGMGGGPPGGMAGPSDDAMAKQQALQWLLASGSQLSISGSEDALVVGWHGIAPIAVTVGQGVVRQEIPPDGKMLRLKARWEPGEMVVERRYQGAEITEHLLFPEGDQMVVVLEIEPPMPDMEPIWIRRIYTRPPAPETEATEEGDN